MKTIHVSDEVWEALLKLKAEMRARSMDDVLRRILSQVVKIPPGQNTDLSTGQVVQVPTGQVTKVSADQSTTVPPGQVTEESERRRKPSPLDSVEDLALVRGARDPDRLARAAGERGLLVYSLAELGLPRTVVIMSRRYRDFVVSAAEGDRTPPGEVRDVLVNVLRDKPRELSAEEKYAVALAALSAAGELEYTEEGWRPAGQPPRGVEG